jgi:outer membrane receptor protein involved in Fe transport
MADTSLICGTGRSFTTHQHQTLANGYIGFASTDKDMPIQFAAEAGMRYFKMKYATMYQKDGNENNLYVKGDVWKKIGDESRAGLKVKFDNYSYSSESMDGATAVDLNPYYGYENDDWRVRLGANVDWWSGVYNIGTGDENKIYVSPDVSVEHFFADSYVFYAKAEGSRQTNSFYQLTTHYSPYWMTRDLLPTYVALDAALGIKGSPMNGLWFHLSGGYKITENDFVPVGLTADYDAYFASVTDCKTKLFYGTGELKYDFKDVWNMYLKGTYYSWKSEGMMLSTTPDAADQDVLGLLPEFEINAGVGFKVLEGLKVNVGYDLVKRRDGDRFDPISNLHAGADYALLKNVSIFAKVNNLLNKEYVRHDGYPAQKLNLLAGVSLQF